MLGVSKSLVDKCCVGDGVSSSVFFPVCGFEGRMGKAFAGSEVFFCLFFSFKGQPPHFEGRGVIKCWHDHERSGRGSWPITLAGVMVSKS